MAVNRVQKPLHSKTICSSFPEIQPDSPRAHPCVQIKSTWISLGKSNFELHVFEYERRTTHSRNKLPSWNVNKHEGKTSFCIERTIRKPLKLSAPLSESFIRSPHPLCRYNFHLLNGPLLVSLPCAQRHTAIFRHQPWFIFSLNSENNTQGSGLMSRAKWSKKCRGANVTSWAFNLVTQVCIPSNYIVWIQCILYTEINRHTVTSENVFRSRVSMRITHIVFIHIHLKHKTVCSVNQNVMLCSAERIAAK